MHACIVQERDVIVYTSSHDIMTWSSAVDRESLPGESLPACREVLACACDDWMIYT